MFVRLPATSRGNLRQPAKGEKTAYQGQKQQNGYRPLAAALGQQMTRRLKDCDQGCGYRPPAPDQGYLPLYVAKLPEIATQENSQP